MERIRGFPPIARADARILILGSMPGQASLDAQQYYAHPRNAFWPILGAAVGVAPGSPYSERTKALQANGIAVWDVLSACVRPGSLDTHIEAEEANDFAGFLGDHPNFRRILFNGAAAEALFRRHVVPTLPIAMQQIPRHRLPSTSPAHASQPLAAKRSAWLAALVLPGPEQPARNPP